MSAKDRDHQPDGLGSQRLPGTGGDLSPTDQDTEGHRFGGAERNPATPEEGEGHRFGGGQRNPSASDEDDVEGHLYTGDPSTRGEFIRRAPGDSPHGD